MKNYKQTLFEWLFKRILVGVCVFVFVLRPQSKENNRARLILGYQVENFCRGRTSDSSWIVGQAQWYLGLSVEKLGIRMERIELLYSILEV